jgi:hypothetical protein
MMPRFRFYAALPFELPPLEVNLLVDLAGLEPATSAL